MIKMENDKRRYFDKNGVEIREGDEIILSEGGTPLKVYLCADGQLGLDATNPAWIKVAGQSPANMVSTPDSGGYSVRSGCRKCIRHRKWIKIAGQVLPDPLFLCSLQISQF